MSNNTEMEEKYLVLQKEYNQFLKDAIATEKQLQLNKVALELVSEKYVAARALLEKFISRHEAGLLPDMFIYNDIKTFLDGK